MYKNHFVCRACGFGFRGPGGTKAGEPENLIPVLDLGLQPLANDFAPEAGDHAGYAPLKVLYCPRCTLAQLSVTVDPKILYSRYAYVTSPSDTMQQHFGRLAGDIKAELESGSPSLVEIGSNDGRLLGAFKKMGFSNVCGIDPAENLTELSRKDGIPTVTGVLDSTTAKDARSYVGRVDVILARHVFCHVDNWMAFVSHLSEMCHQETLVCIEVPYVHDLLEKVEFDTIYHEHTSYMSLRAIEALLTGTQLRLHRIIRYAIHGGAMLLMLRLRSSVKAPHSSVQMFLGSEEVSLPRWRAFEVEARKRIDELKSFILHARTNGKRVVGFGASAKSTVWINAMGLTRKDMEAVYDNTQGKWWTQIPGTDIPVVNEGAFFADAADYAVCFAWNYKAEILEKHAKWRAGGGKFVFPVPQIEIV